MNDTAPREQDEAGPTPADNATAAPAEATQERDPSKR
jgi:hypothetical protein